MTMENMGELTDQQIDNSSTTPISSSQSVSEKEFTVTPKQEFVDPNSVDSASVSPGVGESSPSGELPSSELSSGELESPAITRADLVSVIPVSMIDTHEFRSQMGEIQYQTLNGRMSPGYSTNYATLTPLQPLPPISTVSDKFLQNSANNFQLINNMNGLQGMENIMTLNNYNSYEKMMTPVSIPISMMGQMNGYNQTISYTYNVGQNGLPSPKQDMKPILSPVHSSSYDPYQFQQNVSVPSRMHSPMKIKQCDSPIPMMQGSNGLHLSPGMESTSPHSMHSGSPQHQGMDQNGKEVEEINTKELAQRISSELKRYSIPQAVFAQRVLCRSQGTLSDLLRNPKPWSKLKSGRETFRRMWKWLQEPEFQRMSALRLAACLQPQENEGPGEDYNPYNGWNNDAGSYSNDVQVKYEPVEVKYEIDSPGPDSPTASIISNGSTRLMVCHAETGEILCRIAVKRKESEISTQQENRGPKKPRLVFTDIQRRTLHAIFKETKRPSKEMQATIAQQLGLEVTTVANFFMNARRRSVDKWRDDNGNDNRDSAPTGMPKS
ncbi:hepatocyte nuclear factor 6-like isoform X2 [Dreissena polymorpha]|uniref:hepatocyte nuclear factor 6-like isoform X2 n=1 Tax=Dreissena polymorpha TaxID=45954 RepID=UPI0022640258|nr:hepatocyte nuclear factor 6-like isoform X2 [Dreissena polymorpha]